MLSPGQGAGGALEYLHAGGDHSVDVHGWHVTEQEDALIELSFHQLILQLVEDGETNTERIGGVTQQQSVPEVEYLVEREDVAEHGEDPGDGVQVRDEACNTI